MCLQQKREVQSNYGAWWTFISNCFFHFYLLLWYEVYCQIIVMLALLLLLYLLSLPEHYKHQKSWSKSQVN